MKARIKGKGEEADEHSKLKIDFTNEKSCEH